MCEKAIQLRGRVLVTGGAGFIGAALVRRCISLGTDVVVMVREITPLDRLYGVLQRVEVVRADVSDSARVQRLLQDIKPMTVFHLAADLDRRPELSGDRMVEIYRTNVMGTLNVLMAAKSCGAEMIVCTGSCDEYGAGPVPFREGQREQPNTAYGASKAAATLLAQTLHRTIALPVVVLRLAVVYGPGQGPAGFIGAAVDACLRRVPMQITPGEQTRDWVFVDDVVEGLLQAACTPSALGMVINLGTGEERRVKDVARRIEELTGVGGILKIGALPYQPTEVMRYVCSNRLANSVLGWTPRVSLDEGLRRTIEAERTAQIPTENLGQEGVSA